MKLSAKRRTAVYGAVHEAITDLRVEIAKLPEFRNKANDWAKLDVMIAQAGERAARNALAAAEAPK